MCKTGLVIEPIQNHNERIQIMKKKNKQTVKLYIGLPPIADPNGDAPQTDWNEWSVEVKNEEDCHRFGHWGKLGIGLLVADPEIDDDGHRVLIRVGDMDEDPDLPPITASLIQQMYNRYVEHNR